MYDLDKNRLASKATARARLRLSKLHREEFIKLIEEERRKLGLMPSRKSPLSLEEMAAIHGFKLVPLSQL